ncbi:MAG: tetratricopeptide repeat protein [Gemmatimonadetes bacterium]|nr:tetratricopeptide repeat protein [Gemmatimonadota bacterium]
MSAWRRVVSEAHRRSLWQVLGIYLMGSWIGFQVVLGLVEGIGLPVWLPGLAAALFVIGLPIVLATAFVQEGLPGSDARAAETLDPALFPTRDAHPSNPGPVSSPRNSRLSSFLTWRRAIAAGVAAFTLLGVITASWLVLRALGMGPMASLLAAAELAENDRVLIAEFEPRGADSTLAAVVTDAFRIDFARSTVVRSVTTAEIQDVLRRMGLTQAPRLNAELAREIALRDGIHTYVTGEVTGTGSSFVVTARLIGTTSGEVLVALRERARDEDDLIVAVDRISTTLRERTGESLRTIRRAAPLAKVTTPSMEALQAYTQALRASSWEGNPQRAIELHEEAVRLDTSFAAAHRAIAVTWYNRGNADRAIESAERALRFSDRLTEIERASAQSTLHLARAEFGDAAAALERMITLEPTHFAALNNLALVYDAMHDHERAEVFFRRSIAVDTGRFFAYTNLGEHLVLRGRFEEAEQAFRDAAVRAPQSAWPVVSLAVVPYVAGDIAEAESRLRRLLQDPSSPLAVQRRAAQQLYLLQRARGEFDAAARFARMQLSGAGGSAEEEVYIELDNIMTDLFLHATSAEPRRHIAALKAAVSRTDSENVLVDAAAACAWAGDAACAREYLSRAGASGVLRPWSTLGTRSAHAGIARAEGDLARAAEVLRSLRSATCRACEAPFVGRIFEEMNEPDSAAAAYERYIATPSVDRIWTDFTLPVMHEWLGRYYEERNDPRAAGHYARMIELWDGADADLQPRVAAVRERLGRLQPDR